MSKKLVSIVLVFIMVMTMVAPAYAMEEDKQKFLNAVTKTFEEVKTENDYANKYVDTKTILENLSKSSFQYLLDYSVNVDSDKFSIFADFKADPKLNKYLTNIKANLGNSYGEQLDVNVYYDNEKTAINVPKVSDKFYYIRNDVTQEQLNNSAYGGLGFSISDIAQFFPKMNSEILNLKEPEGLYDPYVAVIKKHMDLGLYKSEGTKVVETPKGLISTEKITCTIKPNVLKSFLDDFAYTIETDKKLYNYLTQIYSFTPGMTGSTGYSPSSKELAAMVVQLLVDSVNSIELSSDTTLKYSVYVNNAGYAIRNEFSAESVEEDYINTLAIDFLGTEYLTNDMKVLFSSTQYGSTNEVLATFKGNNVPKNGVFDGEVLIKLFSEGESKVVPTAYINYVWDLNKDKNNFNFAILADAEAKANTTSIAQKDADIELSAKGTYVIDNKNNIISLVLNDVKFSALELVSGTANFNFTLKSISSDEVSIPEGKAVNLLEMTEEELTQLQESMDNFY